MIFMSQASFLLNCTYKITPIAQHNLSLLALLQLVKFVNPLIQSLMSQKIGHINGVAILLG